MYFNVLGRTSRGTLTWFWGRTSEKNTLYMTQLERAKSSNCEDYGPPLGLLAQWESKLNSAEISQLVTGISSKASNTAIWLRNTMEEYALRNMIAGKNEKYCRETCQKRNEDWEGAKWGLGGWYKYLTAAALGECGTSLLVSELPEIRTDSISTHSTLSLAKWLC